MCYSVIKIEISVSGNWYCYHEQYKFLDSKAISGLLTIYVYLILRLFNCCRDECSKRFPDAAQAWSLVSYWPLDHNQSRFRSPHFSNGPASRPLLSESLSRHFLSTISLSIPIFYPPFQLTVQRQKRKDYSKLFHIIPKFFSLKFRPKNHSSQYLNMLLLTFHQFLHLSRKEKKNLRIRNKKKKKKKEEEERERGRFLHTKHGFSGA